MITALDTDTICAIATPPGRSGVGIVRISGSGCTRIAQTLLGFIPTPRHAHYTAFLDAQEHVIDQGIALFFPGPNSFTGEDVLELQGHGGYYVLDTLMQTTLSAGARLARPGEFTERAFLNDKIDLAQAEAIADLIESSSAEAAKSAVRTLQGEFSLLINTLSESIIELRIYLEAAIDFTDEEIDFLSEGRVLERLENLLASLDEVLEQARQGALIREGMNVVIAGKPNAGKSSLLNALAGKDSAIVTDIPGTTRDILNEHINIDGMTLHITDTAGLRESTDLVEQEGIRRALQAIAQADQVLLMVDSTRDSVDNNSLTDYLTVLGFSHIEQTVHKSKLTIIQNKVDLLDQQPSLVCCSDEHNAAILRLSAKEKLGIDILRDHLKACMGFKTTVEGGFIARRRHLDALRRSRECLVQAIYQLSHQGAAELVAEDLRHAHQHLGEITGTFSTDDLLGRIFSSFCIGK